MPEPHFKPVPEGFSAAYPMGAEIRECGKGSRGAKHGVHLVQNGVLQGGGENCPGQAGNKAFDLMHGMGLQVGVQLCGATLHDAGFGELLLKDAHKLRFFFQRKEMGAMVLSFENLPGKDTVARAEFHNIPCGSHPGRLYNPAGKPGRGWPDGADRV